MPDLLERLTEAHRAAATAAARKGETQPLDDDAAPTDAEVAAIKAARQDARQRQALRETELTDGLPAGFRLREVRAGTADGPIVGYLLERLTGSGGAWRTCGRFETIGAARAAAPGFVWQQSASDPARLRAVVGRR